VSGNKVVLEAPEDQMVMASKGPQDLMEPETEGADLPLQPGWLATGMVRRRGEGCRRVKAARLRRSLVGLKSARTGQMSFWFDGPI